MDEDWIAYLFKHCDIVADKDMQILWAKILAGEATKTGTFSKRTLDLVSKMDKKDAELFTTFCQFVWLEWDKGPTSLIYDYKGSIYNQAGIDFSTLQHLESIGLVSTVPIEWHDASSRSVRWHYYGTVVIFSPKNHPQKNNYYVPTGEVLLTQMGRELFPISGASRNDEFFDYMMTTWQWMQLHPTVLEQDQQPDPTTEKEKA